MKRFFKIVLRSFAIVFAAAIAFTLIIQPFFRCWSLRSSILSALDDATSVRVVEHSSPFDGSNAYQGSFQETIYSTITLKSDQIKSLRKALPFSLDYSGSVVTRCIFDEHHRIEITQRDGNVFILHICFQCGEIILNKEESQRIIPLGWRSSLSSFINSLGLRPDGPWDNVVPAKIAQKLPRTEKAFTAIRTERLTASQVIERFGLPDRDIGSGVYLLEYDLTDGRKVVISTPDKKVLLGATLYDPVTKKSELIYK